jgi:hypothetical protein
LSNIEWYNLIKEKLGSNRKCIFFKIIFSKRNQKIACKIIYTMVI